VKVAETITFEVTNEGATPRELELGDQMTRQEHESEMREMGGEMMPDEPNAITVEVGETKSLTWTFAEMGAVEYDCHICGHFAQGMVGAIDVGMWEA
jgi:uncharacterized cupredoxin-like copper-binding protein